MKHVYSMSENSIYFKLLFLMALIMMFDRQFRINLSCHILIQNHTYEVALYLIITLRYDWSKRRRKNLIFDITNSKITFYDFSNYIQYILKRLRICFFNMQTDLVRQCVIWRLSFCSYLMVWKHIFQKKVFIHTLAEVRENGFNEISLFV